MYSTIHESNNASQDPEFEPVQYFYNVIFHLYQIDKLQSSFHQWERISSDPGDRVQLTKELLAACESIEWQVNSQFLDHVVCLFYLL